MSMLVSDPAKLLLVSLAALSLAACSSTGEKTSSKETLELGQQEKIANAPDDKSKDLRAFCPKTVIRAGTETYRTFVNGVKKDDPGALNSLEYQATVTNVVRECNYTVDNLTGMFCIRNCIRYRSPFPKVVQMPGSALLIATSTFRFQTNLTL